jgi:choloylglycine hydrolase
MSLRTLMSRQGTAAVIAAAFVTGGAGAARDAAACSSFLLREGDTVIAGHNLDSGIRVPGTVYLNKAGVAKESRSWPELAYGSPGTHPVLRWVSRHSSITFNTFCRDFPDGGMNDAGLFVAEMSLAGTRFPADESRPLLFMMLRMQHALDSYESVDQVVASARELTLDGWNWHFFAADRSGAAAVIEFLDGEVVAVSGPELEIPLLVNSPYAEELERLRGFRGFGGETAVELGNQRQPAFVRGARLLGTPPRAGATVVERGFELLAELGDADTRWSYLCDLGARRVHVRTDQAPGIRTIDLAAFEPSCLEPPRMLDIHLEATGSVTERLAVCDSATNRGRVRATFIASDFEPVFTANGSSLEAAVARFGGYSEGTHCTVQEASGPGAG